MSNFRYKRWLEKTFSSDVTHQNLDLRPSQLDATKLQRIKRIILIKLAMPMLRSKEVQPELSKRKRLSE